MIRGRGILDQFIETACNDDEKSKAVTKGVQSDDRPEIELKVARYVIESVNFAESHGFYDVTGNFGLDFREMG